MRIVFVSDVVYPYVKGGAEKRIYEVSRRLAARGHDVHLYGMQWWDGPAVLQQEGVTLHGVCPSRALYVNGRRSILEAVWFSVRLLVPLARERFDVLDCNQHPYFPLFVCRLVTALRRAKFFATWHEYWGDYWYEYLGKAGIVGRFLESVTARLPDRLVAVSDRTAAALKSAGIPGQKVLVVSNGIPYSHILQVPPSAERCDAVFAGRLIKDKHVDVLLRACAAAGREKQIRLSVFGGGPELESLKRLAGELGLAETVTFGGFLEEDELIARLKAARLFVLPSSREGFSITTVEALACGLPVITVDCARNYATDLLEEGKTGVVTGLGEAEIAKAMLGLLKDEPERQRMAEECVRAAARYDWEKLVSELERSYSR